MDVNIFEIIIESSLTITRPLLCSVCFSYYLKQTFFANKRRIYIKM